MHLLSRSVFVAQVLACARWEFGNTYRHYVAFLALGFIVCGFISSSANDTCGAFGDSEPIIKKVGIPFFVFRVIWRNFLVVLHTIILVVSSSRSRRSPGGGLPAIPGMALVFLNRFSGALWSPTRRKIDASMDDIIQFTELAIISKLRFGRTLSVAFAIATFPDIPPD
jgi:ABC-type polysaccharide/polyol phosphate export permease